MTNISALDQTALAQLQSNLPQSLIIDSEPGLDIDAVIKEILSSRPTELFNITPEQDKKSIAVEQIRQQMSRFATFAQTRRVVIISPAEKMTPEAQNALLKDLEEPSANLHIILVTMSSDRLLDTIYSRCQRTVLHRLTDEQSASLLADSALDAQSKQQILFLAAGRPVAMRSLMNDQHKLDDMRELVDHAKQLISAQPYPKLVVAMKYAAKRSDSLAVIDVALSILRFQIRKSPDNSALIESFDKFSNVEQRLHHNANVKLAMLQLV